MTRACASCEWWFRKVGHDDQKLLDRADFSFAGVCKEGPHSIVKHGNDGCGRFRMSEAVIQRGGADGEA